MVRRRVCGPSLAREQLGGGLAAVPHRRTESRLAAGVPRASTGRREARPSASAGSGAGHASVRPRLGRARRHPQGGDGVPAEVPRGPSPLSRAAARALFPFALHGLARQVDAAVGRLLHTTLDLPDFVRQALRLMDAADTLRTIAAWTAGGAALWLALAAVRARHDSRTLASALQTEADGFAPLLLRPALTLLALASLAVQPTFPYGFTLPVALTQDWGPAQDAAAVAAVIAWRLPLAMRVPAPGAGAVWF